ncbi:MAG: hypothetical protein J6581_08630 [Apibacter sp.]|nr:hypothetical protein [Apibacter sp.]
MRKFTQIKEEAFEGNKLLPKYNLVLFTWGNEDAEKANPELDIVLPSIEVLGNLIEYSHLR